MRERKAIDDYFMYKEPPDYELYARYLRSPSPISSSRRIVPKIPNEIDESHKKTVIHNFQTAVWGTLKQSKKSESQEPDVDQSNKVAASKLSDLKGKAPEEGGVKTDVPEEKMALERKIAELGRENEELANQLRILNERLEERLEEKLDERLNERLDEKLNERLDEKLNEKFNERLNERLEERLKEILEEVARKEETVRLQGQDWVQKNVTVNLREKSVRERDALQEAKSTTLLQREEEVCEREEKVLRREEQVLEQEEKMAQLQKQLNGKASKLAKTERLVDRFFKERRLSMSKEKDLEPDL
ncbi:hypothetical protein BHYA_0117g00220 [Botrytis hyacinthi]|uniref:Uncharacterized protein n=1 Tax=Botrytis hyacinthi TaxID=278943 RepID=A0A4Z1GKB6_9HELO|nr:hypothetical protein BHYA_0117g00220 [Botrytis hyacinthi]